MKKTICIAGGGISGLYSALQLSSLDYNVILLEASENHWGGRIETTVLENFVTEWGPMRFETKLQPKFGKLIDDLKIDLVPFNGPQANPSQFPQYDLPLQEQNLNALDLLRKGILLMMGKNPNNPIDFGCQNWIDSLTEDDFRTMRKEATLNGKFMWKMGFWNALSEDGILSHQALMKIRDTGTFYHMIPDNLNAIEWVIWWLRAFKTDGQILATIKKGTDEITKQMLLKLQERSNVTLINGARLVSFKNNEKNQAEAVYTKNGEKLTLTADHLLLAMPQYPLKKLSHSLPEKIREQLDSVNGFAMTKVFFILDKPWWEYNQSPQARANRMPTREIHYFRRSKTNDFDGFGMILLYTDKPATEFWNYYIEDRNKHEFAEVNNNDEIKQQFANFMSKDVFRSLQGNEAMSTTGLQLTKEALFKYANMSLGEIKADIEKSIVSYGIRDWSCAPYGAGNHCWRPGVKSWEIQQQFKAFALDNSDVKNIHIIGEAYSDYTGFIEGAINSSDWALEEITGKKMVIDFQ
ncbi:FAD-dependent oxidoreductase [Flavobacterium amniphilum]|uniref:flavin monoamine oxidase family protein n=1 Tax=Flavobacterium amniphilum TaxID=1834035 RepID=UPI002029BFCE|nr:FAD-dependent oxidoreductase [Flavobacterium amniphilum]MCL9804915.1 FAD-dependent oxidoreductase [Flavobacterium amniphilum]